MYQLTNAGVITRLSDGASIPFDPANSDYTIFKSAVSSGAGLNDANGNPMTADQIAAFVATLP
jgi:hypothetical protein